MKVHTTVVTLPTFDLTYLQPVFERDNPGLNFDAIESKYRNYLALCQAYPRVAISPSKDIDALWHCHILHTVGYWADCKSFFGYYLHHVPTILEDTAVAAASAALYQQHFGTTMVTTCGKLATCIIDDQKIATCIIDDSPMAARIDQAQFLHGPIM